MKCLFIAGNYNLATSPVSIINRAFVKSIQDESLSFVVVATGSKSSISNDIITIRQNRILWNFLKVLEKIGLYDFVHRPDIMYISWAKRATRFLYEYLKNNKVDYVHSVSFPSSSHLIAYELKKQYGIPWIAQFMDPWVDNPYNKVKSQKAKQINARQEKLVAEYADIIIHNSNIMHNIWSERYKSIVKGKMYVIPLMSDQPLRGQINNTDSITRISHIGNLSERRNALSFLRAFNNMVKRHPDIQDKCLVQFIGDVSKADSDYIYQNQLTPYIKVTGRISPNECVAYYENSDIFLAFDGGDDDTMFFPSKIIKYFYYGNPILGLVNEGSVLQQELIKSRNPVFSKNDEDKISEFLYEFVEGNKSIDNNKDYWIKFSPSEIKKQYVKLINELV